jgi:uncharacterized membrane protein
LFQFLLLLHIFGAIAATGPPFAFPVIAAMNEREPQHLEFALRLTRQILETFVIPFAISMPVTGAVMIWIPHIDWTRPWLLSAITVYVSRWASSWACRDPPSCVR